MTGALRVPAGALERLVRESFTGLGLEAEDAAAAAAVLLYANLRGIPSHGISRLPAYMRRVGAGSARGTAGMRVVAERGGLVRVDAAGALGPAAALRATDLAIERAAAHGLGVVALGGAGHFGAAGFYAMRAARAGMLALVASNGPAGIAPHGAGAPFLGSNPLAIAAPIPGRDEFVLDIATSVVARGKVIAARDAGEPIPAGVAIDATGQPTTDAEAALAGSLLPFGGAKGSGLAMAIQLLAVLLAGADFDRDAAPMFGDPARRQNLGQIFLVLDPAGIADRSGPARLGDLMAALHRLPPREGEGSVRYPGERAAQRERESLRLGVVVEARELEAWARACDESGLPDLARRVAGLATAELEPGSR